MSGITSIVREWIATFYPGSVQPRPLFSACLLTCFVVSCAFAWFDEHRKVSALRSRLDADDKAGPVLVIEFPNPYLRKLSHDDYGFMLLRNIGPRAATQIHIDPTTKGPYRFTFENINALAPIGHDGDRVFVEHSIDKGGILFSSTHSAFNRSHGLIHALEHHDDLVEPSLLELTIRYRDGIAKRCKVQVISYDLMFKVAKVSEKPSVDTSYHGDSGAQQAPDA